MNRERKKKKRKIVPFSDGRPRAASVVTGRRMHTHTHTADTPQTHTHTADTHAKDETTPALSVLFCRLCARDTAGSGKKSSREKAVFLSVMEKGGKNVIWSMRVLGSAKGPATGGRATLWCCQERNTQKKKKQKAESLSFSGLLLFRAKKKRPREVTQIKKDKTEKKRKIHAHCTIGAHPR